MQNGVFFDLQWPVSNAPRLPLVPFPAAPRMFFPRPLFSSLPTPMSPSVAAGENARTVPQVVIDGKYIGGYTEVDRYLRSLVPTEKKPEIHRG